MYRLSGYPLILGAGGYGVVRTGLGQTAQSKQAVKFLYPQQCLLAQYEFMIHKKIFDAWTTLEWIATKEDHSLSCFVPKPIDYEEDETGCVIVTERLFSSHPKKDYQVHIALSGNAPPQSVNQLISVDFDNKSSALQRGYFYDEEGIKTLIQSQQLTMDDVVYDIGLLIGTIIFGAHYDPYDCEFLLVRKYGELKVSVVDFGKCEPIFQFDQKTAYKIVNHIDLDLYYTPSTGHHNQAYFAGIRKAANVFKATVSPTFFSLLMDEFQQLR